MTNDKDKTPLGESGIGRKLTRFDFLRIAGAVGIAGSGISYGGPKTKIDTPTISCAGSTQVSINLSVCAGGTGLPAGFSIQWMTAADYAANGNAWYSSDDIRLCKASFSGNANLSRYNLGANECTNVNVGEFLFDEGASTNCAGRLTCNTEYVFRAFGHATSTLTRSDFTGNLSCSTRSCGDPDPGNCTLTQGYWKTHGPTPSGNNSNEWPASALPMLLGTVSYTDLQLQSIFDTPAQGNGLISLAHQLIAAKLNIAKGAQAPASVSTAISDADILIGSRVIPPVGSDSLPSSATSGLTTMLTLFNEGSNGPLHCGI